MLFILFIYSISFVNGCNVIWNYDILGQASLEAVSHGCGTTPCNTVPGRIYQKKIDNVDQCWLAVNICNGCIGDPNAYIGFNFESVDCDPCPDCSSCGNGNICAGEEKCITTHQ
eukprot:300970_1